MKGNSVPEINAAGAASVIQKRFFLRWVRDRGEEELGFMNTESQHGMSFSPTHQCWTAMKSRCSNPKNNMFKHYGGRGITVCERWKKFINFLEDMGVKPEGTSIERKDNNAGYCKENCVWADSITQHNNTRVNHLLTFRGRTQTIAQWAREVGITYGLLHARVCTQRWSAERALTEAKREIRRGKIRRQV